MGKKTGILLATLAGLAARCSVSRGTNPAPVFGAASVPGDFNEKSGGKALPFVLKEVSTDATYGFTEKNPIRVGGGKSAGVRNE